MTRTTNLYLLAVSTLVLIIATYLFVEATPFSHASAPTGLQATVATTSPAAVSTNASLVFATSTCAARVITTYASPVMITFSDAQGSVPTGMFGHLQAASTTVAYDSGVYGCGAVRVYSFASQTLTVMESR